MFWDRAAGVYDLLMTLKNGKVNRQLCLSAAAMLSPDDTVLECACGTGMISEYLAAKCTHLTATDYSEGMLKQTRRKCRRFSNVTVMRADITALPFAGNSFDKVIAANVIHLLADPAAALNELERVCRPGGTIIVPTYINRENSEKPGLFVKAAGLLGAGFQTQFSYASYQEFFRGLGRPCRFELIGGRMPCAIAVIRCEKA